MTKNFFIGANWKMNAMPAGAVEKNSPYKSDKVETVVFPTYLDLKTCAAAGLKTGAQYAHPENAGAFTGDVCMKMVKASGASYVLCGHSERRQHHQESNEAVARQVESALKNDLIPVLCIGETADQREMGETEEILKEQLTAVTLTSKLTPENCVVAYEPVWAIGTGKTPTGAEAEALHKFIRGLLPDKKIRIVYGGSMNQKNAAEFLAEPNIDGGLIGGASLKPEEFRKIVEAAEAKA